MHREDRSFIGDLDPPFDKNEVRDLALRIDRVLAMCERQEEEAEERPPFRVPREVHERTQTAVQAMTALATVVGLHADVAFASDLVRWAELDPYYDKGNRAALDYVSGLSRVLEACDQRVWQRAAEHRLGEVRHALARALPLADPRAAAFVERLLLDDQWQVTRALRRRIRESPSDLRERWSAAVWHAPIFRDLAVGARAGASSARTEHPAASWLGEGASEESMRRLAELFDEKQYASPQVDAVLLELVAPLSNEVALSILRYRLQAADHFPTAALIDAMLERPGGAVAVANAAFVAVQNDPTILVLKFEGLLGERSLEVRTEVGRELSDAWCRQERSLGERCSDRLLTLLGKTYPSAADPGPLWRAFEHGVRLGLGWRASNGLLNALTENEQLVALREPVLAFVLEHGLGYYQLRGLVDDSLKQLPVSERDAFLERAQNSQHDDLSAYALHATWVLAGKRLSASECRALVRRALEDSRLAALLRTDQHLLWLALPELRRELSLDMPLALAHRVMHAIGAFYGGVAVPQRWARVRPGQRPQERAGAFYEPDGRPPTDREWEVYGALQRRAFEVGEEDVLGELPAGPWPAPARELWVAVSQRYQPLRDDSSILFRLLDQIEVNPDPGIANAIIELYRKLGEDGASEFVTRDLAEALQRMGVDVPSDDEQTAPVVTRDDDWADDDESTI